MAVAERRIARGPWTPRLDGPVFSSNVNSVCGICGQIYFGIRLDSCRHCGNLALAYMLDSEFRYHERDTVWPDPDHGNT